MMLLLVAELMAHFNQALKANSNSHHRRYHGIFTLQLKRLNLKSSELGHASSHEKELHLGTLIKLLHDYDPRHGISIYHNYQVHGIEINLPKLLWIRVSSFDDAKKSYSKFQ